MQLSQITVYYSYTFNMGDYSNIKPAVSITGYLSPDDDPGAKLAYLQAQAEAHVHGVIDAQLEAQDKPPYFFSGLRYDLLILHDDKLVIIFPSDQLGLAASRPENWSDSCLYSNWSYESILAKARKIGLTLIDCSDGDYSRLPQRERFCILIVDNDHLTSDRYLLVGPADLRKDQLPESWQQYWVSDSYKTRNRVRQTYMDELDQRAQEDGLQMLPAFTPKDLAAIPELTLIEDSYDDDDDYDDDKEEIDF